MAERDPLPADPPLTNRSPPLVKGASGLGHTPS